MGPNAKGESAEGLVDDGQAKLVRHSGRKAEQRIGGTAKTIIKGLNGALPGWVG